MSPSLTNLKSRRNPYTEHGDIDENQEGEDSPFETSHCLGRNGKQGDSINDNLHDAVDLNYPEDD